VKVIDREVLSPGGTSRRNLPANLDPADHHLFAHELTKPIPPTELKELRDARLTNEGVILDGLSVFEPSLPDGDLWHRSNLRYSLATRLKRRRTPVRGGDGHLLVFDSEYLGYFHWMTETLTRLEAMGECARHLVLLLPEQRLPFHSATLQPFRFGGIVEVRSDEYLDVERLVMPTHTAPSGNYNDQLIARMAARLRQAFASKPVVGLGRRLYVSRRKAQKRKVANESEMLPLLERHGFRTVCFEDYSFEEQALMSMQSDRMVSLHGAGLTNMLFMDRGSCILELRARGDTHSNSYFSLASALGIPYHYLLCDPRDGADPHTADVVVDPSDMETVLADFVR
jgi:capsular polysaccharide biosynthesis protein